MREMEIGVLIGEEFEGEIESGWLENVATAVLKAEGVDPTAVVGLVITGQEEIRKLNAAHQGEDRPTDVLAFPMTPGPADEERLPDLPEFVLPPDGALHLGEVIISYPQAGIQARERGHPVEKEVLILVVHGILHLLGYDHDIPEREGTMQAREADIRREIEEMGR